MIHSFHTQYKTSPGVIHQPGPVPPEWYYLRSFVLAYADRLKPCEDLTIYTWNSPGPSASTKPLGTFELSCGSVPCVVLKSEKSWYNKLKTELLAEALKTCKTKYFLASDSSDSVIIDHPGNILNKYQQKFEKNGVNLLFIATGRWPDFQISADFAENLPEAQPHFLKHLGSGSVIGRTDLGLEFYECAANLPPIGPYFLDDNTGVRHIWPQYYDRGVRLDYTSEIFAHQLIGMHLHRPIQCHTQTLIDVIKKTLKDTDKFLDAAEIGCWHGETSAQLLRAFPNLRLWMIDPWRADLCNQAIGKGMNQGDLKFVMGSALYWTRFAESRRRWIHATSESAYSTFKDESLDFAFIDGDHLIAYQDCQMYWPKIKPGGILIGHDYDNPHIFPPGECAVKRDVDRFASELGKELYVEANMIWWIQK